MNQRNGLMSNSDHICEKERWKLFLGEQLVVERGDEKCCSESNARTRDDGRALSNNMERRSGDEKGFSTVWL
jgi:hypothetical protein